MLHTHSACSLTCILAQWPDAVEADVVPLQPQASLAVSHYAMFMTNHSKQFGACVTPQWIWSTNFVQYEEFETISQLEFLLSHVIILLW